MRVAADEIALRHVLDHRRGDVTREGGIVGFAVAHHPAVGRELDEDEVAAAQPGGRVADHERLHVGDFHAWSSRIMAAPFHPTMVEAALVLPLMFLGKTDASTTRRARIDDRARRVRPHAASGDRVIAGARP